MVAVVVEGGRGGARRLTDKESDSTEIDWLPIYSAGHLQSSLLSLVILLTKAWRQIPAAQQPSRSIHYSFQSRQHHMDPAPLLGPGWPVSPSPTPPPTTTTTNNPFRLTW